MCSFSPCPELPSLILGCPPHWTEIIENLEKTVRDLCTKLATSEKKVDNLNEILCAHQQKHECETLYANGHVLDAAQCLLDIKNTASDDVKADKIIMNWLSGEFRHHRLEEVVDFPLQDFTRRSMIALESTGDQALEMKNHNEARVAYSTALSLGPSPPSSLLGKWTRIMLLRGSTQDVLDAAAKV